MTKKLFNFAKLVFTSFSLWIWSILIKLFFISIKMLAFLLSMLWFWLSPKVKKLFFGLIQIFKILWTSFNIWFMKNSHLIFVALGVSFFVMFFMSMGPVYADSITPSNVSPSTMTRFGRIMAHLGSRISSRISRIFARRSSMSGDSAQSPIPSITISPPESCMGRSDSTGASPLFSCLSRNSSFSSTSSDEEIQHIRKEITVFDCTREELEEYIANKASPTPSTHSRRDGFKTPEEGTTQIWSENPEIPTKISNPEGVFPKMGPSDNPCEGLKASKFLSFKDAKLKTPYTVFEDTSSFSSDDLDPFAVVAHPHWKDCPRNFFKHESWPNTSSAEAPFDGWAIRNESDDFSKYFLDSLTD